MNQKAIFTPYIYIVLFYTAFSSMNAQKIQLTIAPADSVSTSVLNTLKLKPLFYNSLAIEKHLDSVAVALNSMGYLNPQFELINNNSNKHVYLFTAGTKNNIITIYVNEPLPSIVTNKLAFKNNTIEVPIDKLDETFKFIIDYYAVNGYPFTTITLKNQSILNNNLVATLEINKNTSRTIDKIIIEGYPAFPIAHLKHATALKIGSSYNQQKLIQSSAYLNKLSFVSEIKPPEVLFTKDSTYIYLYLQKKKAHQFDGLIGFNTAENSSKLKLYGYLTVNFNNLLNKGEQFTIKWNNTGTSQTNFYIENSYPYLFNSPFSFEGSFELQKQDSTYYATIFNTGLSYRINAHQLKGMFEQQNSNLLSTTTNLNIREFKKQLLGIAYLYELIRPNRFFSTEFAASFKAFTGKRSNGVNNNSQQQLEFLVNYTAELNNRNYFFIQNQSKKIISNTIYYNELFKIGGSKTLRGFNEQQILSDTFTILTIEYRYLTSTDSYLYSISDVGFIKNTQQFLNEHLIGLGLGYSFKISNGFLSLSYAVGKYSNSSFDFQNAKIHISLKQSF